MQVTEIIKLYHTIARIHRVYFKAYTSSPVKRTLTARDYTEEKTALNLHYWTAPEKKVECDVRFFFALIHLEFCTPKDRAHEKIRI